MDQKCPNCNEFEYSKNISTRGWGFRLLIGGPLICIIAAIFAIDANPNAMFWFTLAIIAFLIIGALVIIISFISPQKTIEWSCTKCKFQAEHLI